MQSNITQNEFLQGSIVWAFYPLTDKIDKTKRRPVLIVSNEQSNVLDNDYVVLPITRAIRAEPFSLLIEPMDVEGDLPVNSEIRCNKPFTLRRNLMVDAIGVLNLNSLKKAIDLLYEATKL